MISLSPAARALSVSVLLYAPMAQAQGWVRLPNGEAGYTTGYTSSAFFACGNAFYLVGTCQASGNSITLGSGGSTMTMVFQGLSQIITASAIGQSVHIGTVTKTFGGTGPFQFPTATNVNAPLFFFSILLNSSNPAPRSGGVTFGFLPSSRTSIPANCCDYWDIIPFHTITPPAGIPHYPTLLYHSFRPTMTAGPDPITISAMVAIIPEPATIWLTGTGLAGVLALVRRRRHRRR